MSIINLKSAGFGFSAAAVPIAIGRKGLHSASKIANKNVLMEWLQFYFFPKVAFSCFIDLIIKMKTGVCHPDVRRDLNVQGCATRHVKISHFVRYDKKVAIGCFADLIAKLKMKMQSSPGLHQGHPAPFTNANNNAKGERKVALSSFLRSWGPLKIIVITETCLPVRQVKKITVQTIFLKGCFKLFCQRKIFETKMFPNRLSQNGHLALGYRRASKMKSIIYFNIFLAKSGAIWRGKGTLINTELPAFLYRMEIGLQIHPVYTRGGECNHYSQSCLPLV